MTRIRTRSTEVVVETAPLPAEARLAVADRLAQCHQALFELGLEKARVQNVWGQRQGALEQEIRALSKRVKDGNVETALSCPIEYDLERRVRVVVHPGTGEVVSERAMTDSDDADLRAQGLME